MSDVMQASSNASGIVTGLNNTTNVFSQNIFDLKNTLDELVEFSWPKNFNKPSLCCFDNLIGPKKSEYLNNNLGIEKDVEQDYIVCSIDNASYEMPFCIKSYKNDFLVSYSFHVSNFKEKRGLSTACTIISKIEKKKFDIVKAEENISEFAESIANILENYLNSGGKL